MYDGLNRLVQESETGGQTVNYTYDTNGNRAQMVVTGAENFTTDYAYDANNRLLTETEMVDGEQHVTTYTYDANGNTLQVCAPSGRIVYSYDVFNQLCFASTNMASAAYAYNAQGLRIAKATTSGITQFLLDGDNVAAEVVNDQLSATYLRGANLISRNEEYYLFNAHGDVVNLTSAGGVVTKSYAYDAFGNERNPDEADANPFRYCGEYFDSETGTYYLRARYYDPAIGRFTQADTHWSVANMIYGDTPRKINEREDALGLKTYTYAPQITAIMQSGNLYVYGVDNPVMYADMSGNFVITTAALLVCGGALLFGTVGGLIGNHIANKNGITGWGRVGYITGGAAIGAVGGGLLGYAAAPAVASATGVSGVSVTAAGITTVTTTSILANPAWQGLYDRTVNHIFSSSHISNGIMRLGRDATDIFNKLMTTVMQTCQRWEGGSNEIRTTINGIDTTIRFFVRDGNVINIDAFVGFSNRTIGNLINLIK